MQAFAFKRVKGTKMFTEGHHLSSNISFLAMKDHHNSQLSHQIHYDINIFNIFGSLLRFDEGTAGNSGVWCSVAFEQNV